MPQRNVSFGYCNLLLDDKYGNIDNYSVVIPINNLNTKFGAVDWSIAFDGALNFDNKDNLLIVFKKKKYLWYPSNY